MPSRILLAAGAFIVSAALSPFATSAQAADPLVFISSFASGDKGGIQAYHLDVAAGTLKPQALTKDLPNPFYLAISPDQKYLYSIYAKAFGGKEPEEVAAFELVGRGGELKPLNRQSSKGTASCYLHVDATGKTILVANYTSGDVASLPIKADGSLGEAASYFEHLKASGISGEKLVSHAHSIITSPNNKFAYAADLGLDRVFIYKLDAAAGKMAVNEPNSGKTPAKAGPRHVTFHPGGKWLYAIGETGNVVTVFDYDAETGGLTEKQTISTVPADFTGKSFTADVKVTPNGKFLYGTNRGHDSVACYKIGDDGRLTLLAIEPSLGKGPQNLAITAGGELLLCANMPGNNVVVFRIGDDGKLKAVGEPITQTMPSCIMLVK